MDRVKFIGISLLLLLGGCLTTPPVIHQAHEDADPFRFALASNPFAPPTKPFFESFDIPTYSEEIPDEPIEFEISEEISEEDEILFKPSVIPVITVAEQEELLRENLWVQNVNLINMLDTGRRLSASDISPEDRARRDRINRLNLSEQERARRQNQQFDYADGSLSDWRWMHRGVDRLYATPERRECIEVFLRNRKYREDPKYRTLRANAAILLGREGKPVVASFLLQLARDTETHIRIRCAAVEVLGHLPMITADDLIPLLDEVKERKVEITDRRTGETRDQRDLGIMEIWAELLIAIAEKIDPWEHPCFLEPFFANNSTIRLENAKIWRRHSLQKRPAGESIPEKFLEIARRESNSQVRVEIIRTLGAWQVPDLFPILEADLRHPVAEVRNATMQALADARSQEALPIIKDQLRETNGVSRAAAVSALRRLGAFDEVFKSVNDQDWRVRVEVAQAFAERRTPQTATFAQSYLSDRWMQVQSTTVETISGWSIDESGPLLLVATESQFSEVRRRATEILAQRGVSYPGFDPEDRPANQTVQREELKHVFRETIGVNPNLAFDREDSTENTSAIRQVSAIVPENFALTEVRRCLDDWLDRTLPQEQRQLIHRRLTAHGSRLMPMIDHLMTVENRTVLESLDRVFAEVDPMFGEIEKLRSGDRTAQQQAARELARLGATENPSKLAAKRIVDLAARQSDPMVLSSLLTALRNADPELVCELARPLLQSESVAVRRLACEMLAQFGTSEDIALLREALRDPNREVVRGALSAIDTLVEPGTLSPALLEALNAMLLHSDPMLQTDTAATLHRLGRSDGTDALRRLAATNDNRIKIYAAHTISGLGDPAFVPILLRFLDDGNNTVRSHGLEGLPRAVGQDIGRAGLNPHSNVAQTQQQIDRWKAWARERQE